MGKAGRVACIFTPYVLTIASLICLIFVGLGCTRTNSPLNEIFFIKIDMKNLKTDSAGTDNSLSAVAKGLQAADSSGKIRDFYTVGLWNYCYGDSKDGKDVVDKCSPRKTKFWFDPKEVWELPDNAEELYPKALNNGLNSYKKAAGWMFIAYIVAIAATAAEILIGITAIFSRWGSFATTVCSAVSSVFTVGASATATVMYTLLAVGFEQGLKDFNVKANLGTHMFAVTWLAAVLSLAAGLFWLFSVCCCSGSSPYSHKERRGRVTAEKTPYTYERVQSPYGHNASSVPLHNMPPGRDMAYEPYRHGA